MGICKITVELQHDDVASMWPPTSVALPRVETASDAVRLEREKGAEAVQRTACIASPTARPSVASGAL